MFFPQPIREVILAKADGTNYAGGFTGETSRESLYVASGMPLPFFQDNQSVSSPVFVVSELHFQIAPSAQRKLRRCVRGATFDVANDIHEGSPSFRKRVNAELTAANANELYVLAGLTHSSYTPSLDCKAQQKLGGHQLLACDRGLALDDRALGIVWSLNSDRPISHDKDLAQPRLGDLPQFFLFGPPAVEPVP